MNYYQPEGSYKYALYSQSLDRFLLVDHLDLWSVVRTGQLLSSRISTLICVFVNEAPPFQNEDCLTWSLQDKEVVLPKHQTPVFHEIKNQTELVKKGIPDDFKTDRVQLLEEQDYCLFVLKAVTAAKLVNLKISLSAQTYNEDQKQYLELFPDQKNFSQLKAKTDRTIWEKGFLNKIESILYNSKSKKDVFGKIQDERKKADASNNFQTKSISAAYLDLFADYAELNENA